MKKNNVSRAYMCTFAQSCMNKIKYFCIVVNIVGNKAETGLLWPTFLVSAGFGLGPSSSSALKDFSMLTSLEGWPKESKTVVSSFEIQSCRPTVCWNIRKYFHYLHYTHSAVQYLITFGQVTCHNRKYDQLVTFFQEKSEESLSDSSTNPACCSKGRRRSSLKISVYLKAKGAHDVKLKK